MWFLAYVVLSTFLANVSSDAVTHRVFIILLILSWGEEQCLCTFMYVSVHLEHYPICLRNLGFLDKYC